MTPLFRLVLTKRVVLVALLAAATACGGSSQSTTSPSTTTNSPTSETFSSVLGVRGVTSHTFVAKVAGTISITLTAVGPPSVPIGLGIGVTGGAPCLLNTKLTTVAGGSPQISVTADPGRYCVEVYDVGNLVDPISFSLTIQHP